MLKRKSNKFILWMLFFIQLSIPLTFSNSFIIPGTFMTFQEYRYLLFPELSPINNVYYVRIGADTIVNAKTYYKLERTPDSTNLSWELIGLVRETPSKRIYFKPLQENEKLLFDFSLNLNVTATFYSFVCSNPEVKLKPYLIDSVELHQKYYKRLYLKSPDNLFQTVWIEGIGDSITGIFQSVNSCPGGISQRLLCHFNGTSFLLNNNKLAVIETQGGGTTVGEIPFNCINPLITKVQPIQKNNISVYPNPVKETLHLNINNNNLEDIYIRILSIKGQLKYWYNCKNSGKTISLNLKNLPNGIYILEVNNCNRVERYKLLKE